jgi:hypothetical protein
MTPFLTFYETIKFDELVKNQKEGFAVIPANPGSSPGRAPEASSFHES